MTCTVCARPLFRQEEKPTVCVPCHQHGVFRFFELLRLGDLVTRWEGLQPR